jgi:8-amino-7-oxononanoate synthase
MQRADGVIVENQRFINFSSNDYLGLAAEGLADAVAANLNRTGWGAGSSPIISGRASGHQELESALANFQRASRQIVAPSQLCWDRTT